MQCGRCGFEISSQGWKRHSASCDGKGPRGRRPKEGPGQGWAKGTKLSQEHREKISASLTGRSWEASSPEVEKARRLKISAAMKAHPNGGGYRKGSGIGKGCWYESPIAGRVWLDSTYELRVAKCLDRLGISWSRNWEKFPYEWLGQTHHYVPDFKILEGYIEVKGFVRGKDKNKWRDFPHPLFVLLEKDICEMESGGVPKWS